ncbi:MAG: autotransporter-associated beta strand repeat-containing protein [Chthoniobacterales bacterium]
MYREKIILALAASFLLVTSILRADSGTWLANPVDNNWNNPANWSSGTVPSIHDTATLAFSTITSLSIHDFSAVDEMFFPSGASAYTFVLHLPMYFSFYLTGIVNESGVTQNFLLTARSGGMEQGVIIFDYGTTAGTNTAFTCEAATTNDGAQGSIQFEQSSAGSGTYHNLGATISGGVGGRTDFYYNGCSAENSTIINDGATADGATGGGTAFQQAKPSAGNATLIANGGTDGGGGGSFVFADASLGGTARLEVFGNGYADLSRHIGPSFTIGSIEGDGVIYVGRTTFLVGSNSLSTIFSGVLHPGGPGGHGNGSGALVKIGDGSLTLTGANLYKAGTTVSAGALMIDNAIGSGTGPGEVRVNGGMLGGRGIISGAVTIGGTGVLAPAVGARQATLTIQSALTINAHAAYACTFRAAGSQAIADEVVANGVTINSGATFVFSGTAQGTLTQGLVLTVISNTAATPISGTFSNLPDGAILTVNGNNFQASYEGGDGNDLTLTVVM